MIQLRNIHKSFGENHVLQGVDLEVQDGEVVSIIGASGSGKSTFLRTINFLEPADEGEISTGLRWKTSWKRWWSSRRKTGKKQKKSLSRN